MSKQPNMTSPLQVTMNDLPTVKEGAPFTPLRFAIVHILPACRLHYQHLHHHRHHYSYFNPHEYHHHHHHHHQRNSSHNYALSQCRYLVGQVFPLDDQINWMKWCKTFLLISSKISRFDYITGKKRCHVKRSQKLVSNRTEIHLWLQIKCCKKNLTHREAQK